MNVFELRVLDTNFNDLFVVTDYISVLWNDVYCGTGTFSIQFPANYEDIDQYKTDYYIHNMLTDTYMVIESIAQTEGEDGTCTVSGRSIESLLERRVIAYAATNDADTEYDSTYYSNFIAGIYDLFYNTFTRGKCETINTYGSASTLNSSVVNYENTIRDSVTDDMIVEYWPARTIANFSMQISDLQDPQNHIKQSIANIDANGDSFYSVLEALCSEKHFGFKINVNDDHSLTLVIYDGNIKDDVVLTYATNDLSDLIVTRTVEDEHTIAYVKGDTIDVEDDDQNDSDSSEDDEDEEPQHYYSIFSGISTTGWGRKEVLVSSDVERGTLSNSKYACKMFAQGNKELNAYNRKLYQLDASLNEDYSNYIYGTDYSLGDVVCVHANNGQSQNVRVSEFTCSDDSEGLRFYPVFEEYDSDEWVSDDADDTEYVVNKATVKFQAPASPTGSDMNVVWTGTLYSSDRIKAEVEDPYFDNYDFVGWKCTYGVSSTNYSYYTDDETGFSKYLGGSELIIFTAEFKLKTDVVTVNLGSHASITLNSTKYNTIKLEYNRGTSLTKDYNATSSSNLFVNVNTATGATEIAGNAISFEPGYYIDVATPIDISLPYTVSFDCMINLRVKSIYETEDLSNVKKSFVEIDPLDYDNDDDAYYILPNETGFTSKAAYSSVTLPTYGDDVYAYEAIDYGYTYTETTVDGDGDYYIREEIYNEATESSPVDDTVYYVEGQNDTYSQATLPTKSVTESYFGNTNYYVVDDSGNYILKTESSPISGKPYYVYDYDPDFIDGLGTIYYETAVSGGTTYVMYNDDGQLYPDLNYSDISDDEKNSLYEDGEGFYANDYDERALSLYSDSQGYYSDRGYSSIALTPIYTLFTGDHFFDRVKYYEKSGSLYFETSDSVFDTTKEYYTKSYNYSYLETFEELYIKVDGNYISISLLKEYTEAILPTHSVTVNYFANGTTYYTKSIVYSLADDTSSASVYYSRATNFSSYGGTTYVKTDGEFIIFTGTKTDGVNYYKRVSLSGTRFFNDGVKYYTKNGSTFTLVDSSTDPVDGVNYYIYKLEISKTTITSDVYELITPEKFDSLRKQLEDTGSSRPIYIEIETYANDPIDDGYVDRLKEKGVIDSNNTSDRILTSSHTGYLESSTVIGTDGSVYDITNDIAGHTNGSVYEYTPVYSYYIQTTDADDDETYYAYNSTTNTFATTSNTTSEHFVKLTSLDGYYILNYSGFSGTYGYIYYYDTSRGCYMIASDTSDKTRSYWIICQDDTEYYTRTTSYEPRDFAIGAVVATFDYYIYEYDSESDTYTQTSDTTIQSGKYYFVEKQVYTLVTSSEIDANTLYFKHSDEYKSSDYYGSSTYIEYYENGYEQISEDGSAPSFMLELYSPIFFDENEFFSVGTVYYEKVVNYIYMETDDITSISDKVYYALNDAGYYIGSEGAFHGGVTNYERIEQPRYDPTVDSVPDPLKTYYVKCYENGVFLFEKADCPATNYILCTSMDDINDGKQKYVLTAQYLQMAEITRVYNVRLDMSHKKSLVNPIKSYIEAEEDYTGTLYYKSRATDYDYAPSSVGYSMSTIGSGTAYRLSNPEIYYQCRTCQFVEAEPNAELLDTRKTLYYTQDGVYSYVKTKDTIPSTDKTYYTYNGSTYESHTFATNETFASNTAYYIRSPYNKITWKADSVGGSWFSGIGGSTLTLFNPKTLYYTSRWINDLAGTAFPIDGQGYYWKDTWANILDTYPNATGFYWREISTSTVSSRDTYTDEADYYIECSRFGIPFRYRDGSDFEWTVTNTTAITAISSPNNHVYKDIGNGYCLHTYHDTTNSKLNISLVRAYDNLTLCTTSVTLTQTDHIYTSSLFYHAYDRKFRLYLYDSTLANDYKHGWVEFTLKFDNLNATYSETTKIDNPSDGISYLTFTTTDNTSYYDHVANLPHYYIYNIKCDTAMTANVTDSLYVNGKRRHVMPRCHIQNENLIISGVSVNKFSRVNRPNVLIKIWSGSTNIATITKPINEMASWTLTRANLQTYASAYAIENETTNNYIDTDAGCNVTIGIMCYDTLTNTNENVKWLRSCGWTEPEISLMLDVDLSSKDEVVDDDNDNLLYLWNGYSPIKTYTTRCVPGLLASDIVKYGITNLTPERISSAYDMNSEYYEQDYTDDYNIVNKNTYSVIKNYATGNVVDVSISKDYRDDIDIYFYNFSNTYEPRVYTSDDGETFLWSGVSDTANALPTSSYQRQDMCMSYVYDSPNGYIYNDFNYDPDIGKLYYPTYFSLVVDGKDVTTESMTRTKTSTNATSADAYLLGAYAAKATFDADNNDTTIKNSATIVYAPCQGYFTSYRNVKMDDVNGDALDEYSTTDESIISSTPTAFFDDVAESALLTTGWCWDVQYGGSAYATYIKNNVKASGKDYNWYLRTILTTLGSTAEEETGKEDLIKAFGYEKIHEMTGISETFYEQHYNSELSSIHYLNYKFPVTWHNHSDCIRIYTGNRSNWHPYYYGGYDLESADAGGVYTKTMLGETYYIRKPLYTLVDQEDGFDPDAKYYVYDSDTDKYKYTNITEFTENVNYYILPSDISKWYSGHDQWYSIEEVDISNICSESSLVVDENPDFTSKRKYFVYSDELYYEVIDVNDGDELPDDYGTIYERIIVDDEPVYTATDDTEASMLKTYCRASHYKPVTSKQYVETEDTVPNSDKIYYIYRDGQYFLHTFSTIPAYFESGVTFYEPATLYSYEYDLSNTYVKKQWPDMEVEVGGSYEFDVYGSPASVCVCTNGKNILTTTNPFPQVRLYIGGTDVTDLYIVKPDNYADEEGNDVHKLSFKVPDCVWGAIDVYTGTLDFTTYYDTDKRITDENVKNSLYYYRDKLYLARTILSDNGMSDEEIQKLFHMTDTQYESLEMCYSTVDIDIDYTETQTYVETEDEAPDTSKTYYIVDPNSSYLRYIDAKDNNGYRLVNNVLQFNDSLTFYEMTDSGAGENTTYSVQYGMTLDADPVFNSYSYTTTETVYETRYKHTYTSHNDASKQWMALRNAVGNYRDATKYYIVSEITNNDTGEVRFERGTLSDIASNETRVYHISTEAYDQEIEVKTTHEISCEGWYIVDGDDIDNVCDVRWCHSATIKPRIVEIISTEYEEILSDEDQEEDSGSSERRVRIRYRDENGNEIASTLVRYVDDGTDYEADAPDIEGYTFVGWSEESSGTILMTYSDDSVATNVTEEEEE